MKKISLYLMISLLGIISACTNNITETDDIQVKITFADSLYNENISGKLIFLFSSDTSQSLVFGVNPDVPHPVFTYNIKNWNPKDTLVIKNFDGSWYKTFNELDGLYAARLIFDFDTISRGSFVTKNNGYTARQILNLSKDSIDQFSFKIAGKFNGWTFNESENIKEIQLKSKVLSDFWGYDMFVEAAVVLPESYNENQQKKYPLVFVFPGFGSNHASITYGDGQIKRYGMNTIGDDKIFVFCNGEFKQGYHHFANSANNGPWGTALTEEFIPYLENKFRIKQNSRFLMGQSSGAWTSARLQVNYPDLFNGAFIASPDPLDFRAMANNIYAENANFYFPENADSSQLAKGNKEKRNVILEDVLGEFGQIRTWEATFSPKAEDGTITRLFNREIGNVNPEVAETWKQYDIGYLVRSKPAFYREKLKNKLHFFVSEDDPYGLAKSIHLMEEICIKNKINAEFKYFDGLGHNVWTDEMRRHIHEIIDVKKNMN